MIKWRCWYLVEKFDAVVEVIEVVAEKFDAIVEVVGVVVFLHISLAEVKTDQFLVVFGLRVGFVEAKFDIFSSTFLAF